MHEKLGKDSKITTQDKAFGIGFLQSPQRQIRAVWYPSTILGFTKLKSGFSFGDNQGLTTYPGNGLSALRDYGLPMPVLGSPKAAT